MPFGASQSVILLSHIYPSLRLPRRMLSWVGAAPAPAWSSADDVRPQPRQGAARVQHRLTLLAGPRSRSGSMAGDASTRPPSRLHSTAAAAAPRAHTAVALHHPQDQPRHRRVATRAADPALGTHARSEPQRRSYADRSVATIPGRVVGTLLACTLLACTTRQGAEPLSLFDF